MAARRYVLPVCLFVLVAITHVWTGSGLLSRADAPLPPPPTHDLLEPPLFVLTTFKDGMTYGEGVHVVTSSDGRAWRPLEGDPTVFKQGQVGTVVRDPSIIWHRGYFHLVYTTELCAGLTTLSFSCPWERTSARPPPARFGYARSRDLVHWTHVRRRQALRPRQPTPL